MNRYFNATAGAALLVLIAGAHPAEAQTQQGSPTCSGAEYRAFDFWVGEWEVRNMQGQLLGTNRITRAFGGCVLVEQWQSMTSAHAGSSFNIYDRTTGEWHQSWVDNTGLLLQLDGGLVERKMVMMGEVSRSEGGVVMHRITWDPLANDRVRQTWETSADDGETWTVAFDGMYSKR